MRIRWAIATLGVIALAALTITTQMPWLMDSHPEMVEQPAQTEAAMPFSDNSTPTLACPADAKPANFRITLNTAICAECKRPEYGCICDH